MFNIKIPSNLFRTSFNYIRVVAHNSIYVFEVVGGVGRYVCRQTLDDANSLPSSEPITVTLTTGLTGLHGTKHFVGADLWRLCGMIGPVKVYCQTYPDEVVLNNALSAFHVCRAEA